MKLSEIRAALRDAEMGYPQRQGLAAVAVDEIGEALQKLEGLGHHFELTVTDPNKPQEFPQVLYHDSEKPITVANSTERTQAKLRGFRETQAPPAADPAIRPSQEAPPPPPAA